MPLHPEDQGRVRAFNGLDNSIGGTPYDLEAFGNLSQRLMMEAIHIDTRTKYVRKARSWLDINFMGCLAAQFWRVIRIAMLQRARDEVFNILNECAAHRHIHHLYSSANAHQRLTLCNCPLRELNF